MSTKLNGEDINARYIPDALGDAESKNVSSYGGKAALLSFFGKVDYNYNERYYLSATLRRDGSSRLGPNSRWGTFPAFSAGWRLSKDLLPQSQFFTNVMLRAGYGVTGNQSIPSGRTVSQFGGGRGDTYYAVGGGNSILPGYRQTSLGDDSQKWEENTSTNAGLDVEFFGGAASFVLDVWLRSTDNLESGGAILFGLWDGGPNKGISGGLKLQPNGVFYIFCAKEGSSSSTSNIGLGTYVAEETWRFKIEYYNRQSTSPLNTIRAKTWKDGTSEPDWIIYTSEYISSVSPQYFALDVDTENFTFTIDNLIITQFEHIYGQALALIDSSVKVSQGQTLAKINAFNVKAYGQARPRWPGPSPDDRP